MIVGRCTRRALAHGPWSSPDAAAPPSPPPTNPPFHAHPNPKPCSFDVLRKLVLPDGSVLRALLPGRPTRDTLFRDVMRDGSTLLKVGQLQCSCL